MIKSFFDIFQADLIDLSSFSDRGYKYLLTVIDCLSKKAWVEPLKNKTGIEVCKAFKNIVENKARAVPRNLQTDLGTEFYDKHLKRYLKENAINHYSTFSTMKASIVERFNRTLKTWMWKLFSLHGDYKWVKHLNELMHKYHESVHRSIGMKPGDVKKVHEAALLKKLYKNKNYHKNPKFELGSYVRVSKGYLPSWSNEIIEVKKTIPITYQLQDSNGKKVLGGFYEPELTKVNYPNVYLVEKILKTRGTKAYVKWLGFPNSANSWVEKTALL